MAQTNSIQRTKISILQDGGANAQTNRKKKAFVIAPCQTLTGGDIVEVKPRGNLNNDYETVLGSGLAMEAVRQIFGTKAGDHPAPESVFVFGVNKSIASTFTVPAWSDGLGGSRTGDASFCVSGVGALAAIISKTLTAPPGGETLGDRYIVGAGATGTWATHDNEIAEWDGAAYAFTTPSANDIILCNGDGLFYTWNGSAWVAFTSGDGAVPLGDHEYKFIVKTAGQCNAGTYDLLKDGVRIIKDATFPESGSSVMIESAFYISFVDGAASFSIGDTLLTTTTGGKSTLADYITAIESKEFEKNAYLASTAAIGSESGFPISFAGNIKTVAQTLEESGQSVLFFYNHVKRDTVGGETFADYTDKIDYDFNSEKNSGGSKWICPVVDYNNADGMTSLWEIVGKVIRIPVSESIGEHGYSSMDFTKTLVDADLWAEVESGFTNIFSKVYYNKTLKRLEVYNTPLLVPQPPEEAKIRITTVPDIRTIQETELWIRYWFELDCKEKRIEANISAIKVLIAGLQDKVKKSMNGDILDFRITPATANKQIGSEVAADIEQELAKNNQIHLYYELQGFSHLSLINGFLTFQKTKI